MSEQRAERQFEPRIAACLPELKVDPDLLVEGYPLRRLYPEADLDGTVTLRFPTERRDPKGMRRAGQLCRREKGYTPPRWSNYVWITPAPGVDAREAAERLRGVSGASVWVEPEPFPATISVGDEWSGGQGYLAAAPRGVDAAFGWSRPGGTGAGVTVWVVEQAFPDVEGVVQFADLPGPLVIESGASCHWDPAVLAANRKHGARTLGVLAAGHGQGGFAGLCPDAEFRLVCERPAGCRDGCCRPELADLLLFIATRVDPGDIVLIESQVKVDDEWLTDRFEEDVARAGGDPDWFAPVEVDPAVHAAIRHLTAAGATVVEPAGNGGLELQTIAMEGLVVFGEREDSGAILVGAARHDDRTPKASSNLGDRIDCWAWGDGVWTTSWSSFNPKEAIAKNYSGTSAAAAIIAGTAAIVQGVHLARHGVPLSPRGLRGQLAAKDVGTPCTEPGLTRNDAGAIVDMDGIPAPGRESRDLIGVMPDLGRILPRVDQVPDLVVRDRVGDDGVQRGRRATNSPDIVCVRGAGVPADPGAHWGGDLDTAGHPPAAVYDRDPHAVFVRVHNRGVRPAKAASARVWWAPLATILPPSRWTPVGKVKWAAPVAADGALAVSEPFTWGGKALPPPGHYAFVTIVDAPDDPGPELADLGVWPGYLAAMTGASNLAMRNVHVETGAGPDTLLCGFVTGAPQDDVVFGLVVDTRLPPRARAELTLPAELGRLLRVRRSAGEDGLIRIPLLRGRTRIGRGRLPADATFPITITPGLPGTIAGRATVAVRQLHQGTEVGRITWRLRG